MKFKQYGISVLLAWALVTNISVSPLLAAQSRIVPRDATLRLILKDRLSTQDTEVGARFRAAVAEDLQVDGRTVIRRGDVVEGTVTKVEKPKRLAGLQGRAGMTLRFDRIRTNSGEYPVTATLISVHDPVRGLESPGVEDDQDIDAEVDEEGQIEADRDTEDIIKKGAIGVAAGALLGALFGNVSRGLLLGSIGGAVAILAPKGEDVTLREDSGLVIRLDRDLQLSVT
jgi:hypothetical protein